MLRGGEPLEDINALYCDPYIDGRETGSFDPSLILRVLTCPFGGTSLSWSPCYCTGTDRYINGRCQATDAVTHCALPTADTNNGASSCMLAGDPIHIGTGNQYQRVALADDSTLPLDIQYNSAFAYFSTPYTSLTRGYGRVGPGWITAFDRMLAISSTAILAVRPNGERVFFDPVTLAPQTGFNDILKRNVSSTLVTSYQYIDQASAQVEDYDDQGKLLKLSSAQGSWQLTYASNTGVYPSNAPTCVAPAGLQPALAPVDSGKVACVTSELGRQILFDYDASGRIARFVLPSGSQIRLAYDEATSVVLAGQVAGNNLTSVTYADGLRELFHYNEQSNTAGQNLPNALTGISFAYNSAGAERFADFSYDSSGRGVMAEHAGGAEHYSLNFQQANALTVITDPLGTARSTQMTSIAGLLRISTQAQPPGAWCNASSSAITYDANANVSSRTDFDGNKICYAYDLTRNLETKRVEGLAAAANCASALTSPPAGSRVISQQWHPDWRLLTQVAEPKKLTTLVYNGQGATCAPDTVLVDGKVPAVLCSIIEQATNDETGAQSFAASAAGSARTSSYSYTTYGRVLTATDPDGQTTSYSHYPDIVIDPANGVLNLGRSGQLASITDPLGHLTQITDYNANSQATRIVDPNGLVTTLNYDLRQRLLSKTVGSETTSFIYGPVGHLTQVTFPDGAQVHYTYDAAHRLTSVSDQNGNRIRYTLDAMGNRINEQARDPNNVLLRNVARVVDALNRVQQVTGLP